MQPYDKIIKHTDDLYTIDGDWYKTTFRRRMTIIKLNSGGLFIHSPIELEESDFTKINALGNVEYIIAPNSFHDSDSPVYKNRYPNAKLLVSSGAKKNCEKKCKIDGILPDDFPKSLFNEFEILEIKGTRLLNETVFFHKNSKTLIVTDAIFNMQVELSGFEKKFFRWNKIYKRLGPSRIFKWVFTADKEQVELSFQRILKWNFDRIIMNHGDIISTEAKSRLLKGIKEIGLFPRV